MHDLQVCHVFLMHVLITFDSRGVVLHWNICLPSRNEVLMLKFSTLIASDSIHAGQHIQQVQSHRQTTGFVGRADILLTATSGLYI